MPVARPPLDLPDPKDDWRDRLEHRFRTNPPPLASGTVLPTGRVLGVGGEAVVVHAIDVLNDRPLAVRLLCPRSDPAEALLDARTTARNGARSHTPWTPTPVDSWIEQLDDRWHPVVALTYVHGITLHELLAHCSPLTTPELVHVAVGVARSVDDMHRGLGGGQTLVHGDLGLDNLVLLVSRDERIVTPPRVILLDIGGATRIGTRAAATSRLNRLTVTQEQLLGEPLDARTDVAAIGRLVSIMLCSEIVPDEAFDVGLLGGPMLRTMLREHRGLGALAAAELDRVVEAANADDPSRRQADARTLGDDLEAWLAGRPTSRTPYRPLVRMGLAMGRATGSPGRRMAASAAR